jgi:hypothetical protein
MNPWEETHLVNSWRPTALRHHRYEVRKKVEKELDVIAAFLRSKGLPLYDCNKGEWRKAWDCRDGAGDGGTGTGP